jgi:hypothetical protein
MPSYFHITFWNACVDQIRISLNFHQLYAWKLKKLKIVTVCGLAALILVLIGKFMKLLYMNGKIQKDLIESKLIQT